MPRVSVLMPCRDAGPHLADAIRSLQAQSFRDYEVIAVDDGSRDATRALLEAWAARDARVRVHARPPLGIVPALQTAAAAADGEILVRMDADDVAHPERIARQVALLERVDACGTLVEYFPRSLVRDGARRYERWINSVVEHDEIARDMFVECPIAHPTLAVRRTSFEDAGGYRDEDWPEDYDLVLRLWRAGARFGKVGALLLHWRERAERASRTDPRYDAAAFRRCKVHHLRHGLLNGRDVVIWGAGPVGKAFALELQRQGVPVRAFVDLDARKIGQTVHGAPVVAPADVHRFAGALVLAAVGQPGARTQIRQALDAAGFAEGADYVAVA